MAKIGLIDVDSKGFPNLAQMKISAWHKSKGDDVSWYSPFSRYDVVYVSKVFTFTPDYIDQISADKIYRGGTGYAIHGAGGLDYIKDDDPNLPYEIEHMCPDYSIYGITDTAYGFLTRGCPRGCAFCIVGKKEGLKSVKVADIDEFWSGQKHLCLCDPNLLACKEREDLLEQVARTRAWVDFNQGLDIRMINQTICEALNNVRVKKMHFAWDRYQDKDIVLPKFEVLARYSPKIAKSHDTLVYTIVNFDTTVEQDLDRIYTLRKLGIRPYIMIYDKPNAPKVYKRMQQWVNNYRTFAKVDKFEDFGAPIEIKDTDQTALF